MAESRSALHKVKDTLAPRTRLKNTFVKKGSNFIVLESTVSLVFFALAFLVFLPLLSRDSDWLRILIVTYGVFVILWGFVTIYDYLIKSSRLLTANVHNYSLLAGLNAIMGLAIPLFVINNLSSVVVSALGAMRNYGTALCEIRMTLVRFYNSSNIYTQAQSLVFWVLVLGLILIIVGSLLEKLNRERTK